ncbi:MAG: adenylate/guanylate cyclase domain-containing protein [Mycolicibacterium insubricum]|nr:adenylate/guanylate cyclase domain-containing protein [Mycobacterium sp.]
MTEPRQASSGIRTFLFTDIEGSTRRWEADAAQMRADLAAHDLALRQAITGHDGTMFKHTGDGICAVFDSPSAAAAAAIGAQRTLALPVRMGLATGESQCRDGDYFGRALNRAARVMAAGHGGQILLDAATAALLDGPDLIDLGAHTLRDLATPMHLYQLRGAGLPADFPPLRTADPVRGNLRGAATSFVGRGAAVDDVTAALAAHRLVTLIGPGGVGKTRLAVEVGARVGADYPDGVWLIELAAVTDPRAVPEAVAAALGITQQPGLTVAESVAAASAGPVRLLIVDNCEHLLDAAAELVDAVLAASQTVTILATSREGLRAAGEQLRPVAPLDTGAGSASVQLFTDRVHALTPETAPASAADRAAVLEICDRLDGIPLAIELAASRVQAMTVTEIRDRLGDRFRLLVGSRRVLARHQTLHHTVAWSYDLLSGPERDLLNRAAVFTGGFDLAAAAALCPQPDEFATLDLIDALVRKSLVVADRADGRTRYSLLETIRGFAEQRLADSGDAPAVRDAHARYYAGQEDRVLACWDGPGQPEAYRWLATELPNLRSAFRWAADRAADGPALDTAATIACYAALLSNLIQQFEPIGWAEELLEPARRADHPRLAQLYTVAALCCVTGRIAESIGYAEAGHAAVATGRYADIPLGFEVALGSGYSMSGRYDEVVLQLRELLSRDPHPLARACLCLILVNARRYPEARAAAQGLSELADACDNPYVQCTTLAALGWVHIDADPALAYRISQRAMKIAQTSGNNYNEAITAIGLSRLALALGNLDDAVGFLTRAVRNYYYSGSFAFLLGPLALTAVLLHRLGRAEQAARLLGFADQPGIATAFPEVEATMAALRTELGARYRELYAAGAADSNAEAVDCALTEIASAHR